MSFDMAQKKENLILEKIRTTTLFNSQETGYVLYNSSKIIHLMWSLEEVFYLLPEIPNENSSHLVV